MATTINTSKPSAFYPGSFGKRESKMVGSNYKSVIGADSEDITLTADDGVNFVTLDATSGAATLTVPKAEKNPSRVIFIRVSDSTNTALFQDEEATAIVADLAAGQFAYQSNGSSWVRVF